MHAAQQSAGDADLKLVISWPNPNIKSFVGLHEVPSLHARLSATVFVVAAAATTIPRRSFMVSARGVSCVDLPDLALVVH